MATSPRVIPSTSTANSTLSQPARRKRNPDVQARADESPDFITALARGLQVLRCFQPGVTTLGNQDLARLTGLPKPTLSRITYTLTSLGYLRYHGDSGKYSPGYGVLALGYGLLANLELRHLAHPCMVELAQETGGAVALGVFDTDAMLYVEAVHGSDALYLRLPPGSRLPMRSAMGRAYLAELADSERTDLIARLGAAAPSAQVIERACEDHAQTRCCFSIGGWRPDINAVAVSFIPVTGDGRVVMSCGGPASLLPEGVLRDRVAPLLCEAVAQIAG